MHKGTLTLALVVATLAPTCEPPVSRESFVRTAWRHYLEAYVDPAGFVLDPRRDGGTVTSEGQGYALLRAFWERDAKTFARIADWTETRLRRPDGLHSWLFDPAGGRVLDANSATDGDLEIAWALALAADEFGRPAYRARSAAILRAVRAHAAVPLADGWLPAAGNWAVADRVINLSYFVPYAHPWFAALDPAGDWQTVTRLGYDLIERVLAAPDVRLPPAFLRVDSGGRPLPLSPDRALETDFSFDAVRIFWRVEADCALTGRPRACADPLRTARAAAALTAGDRIVTRYRTDGRPLSQDESLSFYAALLPAFRRHVPDQANRVIEPRLGPDRLGALLTAGDRYYDQNWVWFGLALDEGLLAARTPAPPRRLAASADALGPCPTCRPPPAPPNIAGVARDRGAAPPAEAARASRTLGGER